MKKNLFKRGMAGLLSLVMCLTALVGIGTTTAYAAGERAEVYLVSFPRSGDANIDYSGTWGHPNLRYMNGWHSGESKYTTIRAMHSYDGIEIRDCVRKLIEYQTEDYPEEMIRTEQENLNRLYDSYTEKYGLINSRGNYLAFASDESYFLLCSLEVLDDEGNFKRKADMFTKRTIVKHANSHISQAA